MLEDRRPKTEDRRRCDLRIKVQWRDSTHAETQFKVNRTAIDLDGGDLYPIGPGVTWQLVATAPAHVGAGFREITHEIQNGDAHQWWCFYVTSVVAGVESAPSAVSCAPASEVVPGGSNYLEVNP